MSRRAVLLIALLGSGACASTGPHSRTPREPEAGMVIDARTGEQLSAARIDERLAAARVILVAEEHANPLFHAVQREVLERVAILAPGRTAMGIEWLPRSASLALVGFVKASPPVSLDALRVSVAWDTVWGHEFSAYAPLFESARRLDLPIVPLNAEPGLARLVARGGAGSVPAERRAELPPLDSGNPAHRAWFQDRMQAAAHGHPQHALSGEAFERLYLAQLVWDETMAATVIEAAVAHKLVVFAGVGHIERGLGIPARLGALERLVILPVIGSAADARARVIDAEMPAREADLFWLISPSALPPPRTTPLAAAL